LLVFGAMAAIVWRCFRFLRGPARVTSVLATLVVVVGVAAYLVARILWVDCPDYIEGPCGGYGFVVLVVGMVAVVVLAAATVLSFVWWVADRIRRGHDGLRG
jgi:hypothetical protein